jgi:general secretion pathway protein J
MSSRAHRHASHQQGFTLIELLVVMTMLALIMVGLGQAFRSMGQTEVRVDERLQRSDQMRVVQHFLQGALGRLDATSFKTATSQDSHGMLFEATPDSISWVGTMPARPGIGGRHFFRLAIEAQPNGESALVLRHQPWSALNSFPNWQQAPNQVLAPRMTGLQIQAQGLPRNLGNTNANWPFGWQNGWPTTAAELPQRLRLDMQDPQGPWPPLTVSVHASVASVPVSSGFVIGGGR